MSDYDRLAQVYDEFTDGFDHAEYLDFIFNKAPFLPKTGLALDCGCGTGALIRELSGRGYSCSGVDVSPDMLSVAREKLESDGYEPHLVCQPLERLDLYGAYDLCFCALDTVNHLTKPKLTTFFSRLINFTEPGGYFIFDVKTEGFMKKSAELRVYDRDDGTLILDGAYSRGKLMNYITVFSRYGNTYERSDSVIEEHFYGKDMLKELLSKVGFSLVAVYRFHGREIYLSKNNRGQA